VFGVTVEAQAQKVYQ